MVVQIPNMDEILMGYWMAIHVRIIMSNSMYKSKFRMGIMIHKRVLMMSCDMLLMNYLRNTSIIDLLGSVRVRVGSLVDAL